MERYSVCYKSKANLHKAGCPALIAAAALLKDNQTGNVLLQTRLQNISDKKIDSITLRYVPFDINGEALGEPGEQLFEALELESNGNGGAKQPLLLPDELTRSVELSISSIRFADGERWENPDSEAFAPIGEQKSVEAFFSDEELAEQYYSLLGRRPPFAPELRDEMWLCCCSGANALSAPVCGRCRAEKEQLFGLMDEEVLRAGIARQAELEEERKMQAALLLEKKAKNRKRLKKLSIAAVALALFAVFLIYLGIPGFCYGMGFFNMNSGSYDAAIDWYGKAENLGRTESFFNASYMRDKGVHIRHAEDCMAAADYVAAADLYYSVDEDELAKNAYYVMGGSKSEEGLFLEAVEAYKKAGSYSDAKQMMLKNYFLEGDRCFSEKDYENALLNFEKAAGWENAKEREDESRYCYAKELGSKGKNEEAAKHFKMLGKYSDSRNLWQENLYAAADKCFNSKDYSTAAKYYKELGTYLDSADKATESLYCQACACYDSRKYNDAAKLFEDLGEYKESKTKLTESMYAYVLANKKHSDKTTYNYLTQLKAQGYKDSSSIYNELYKWKLEVTGINGSPYDSTSTYSSISKWSTVYVHLKMTGGEPGAGTKLRCVWKLPNGYGGEFWFDGQLSNGDTVYSYHWYDYPAYGSSGTFTANYYDGNGNYLATASIYMS